MARGREAARRRLLLAVYLPTALLAFGQGLLLATLPLYANSFGVSYTLVSLAVAGTALGTLATDVPAGALLGRLGLRGAMLAGAGLVAAATLPLGLPLPFGLLLTLRLLAGVGTALWGLSRHAYIAEAVPKAERGRAISVFGGLNRFGVLAGPALGGLLGEWFGLRASFIASGATAMVALGLSLRFIKPVPPRAEPIDRRARWRLVGRLLRSHRRDLGAAGVAQIFGQTIRAGRQFLIPIYGANALGLNAAQVGFIMTVASVLDVAMFVPAGLTMDRLGRKVAAVPSFAVMAVGVALIPLANSYWSLLLAAIVIGFGNGLGSGTMMTLGADLAPPGATGEFLGLWRLIGDGGMVAGPLVVGSLAGGLGLDGSALALSAIGLAAALTLAFLVRETRVSPLEDGQNSLTPRPPLPSTGEGEQGWVTNPGEGEPTRRVPSPPLPNPGEGTGR